MSNSKRLINPNFAHLIRSWHNGLRGVVLEGGSRSGKTYSCIHFIINLCAINEGPALTINIIKETYNSFKTTLYDDWNHILTQIQEPNPFAISKDIQSFRLWGNKINFIGADQSSKYHGASCDYFYINEALDVQQDIFDQLEMRCRRFWFMDYNPKVTDHWVFDLEKRPDVSFLKTTMLDNPYIGKWEKAKIRGYEPTPENIAAGTADDYMWKVYGLGIRAALQGLVFPDITWIDEFPTDIDRVYYGLDFGYTNSPTALPKVGISGRNLYIQNLIYTPINNPDDLAAAIRSLGITERIWADTADPGSILHLYQSGLPVYGAKKWPGCINYGISMMKGFKIHCVKNPDMAKEANNYKWREINGIPLNEPVDAFNHIWDAVRYVVLMEVAGRE